MNKGGVILAKEVKLRLRVLLAENDWEQKDLVERSNLTSRAVSDLVNDRQKSFTKASLNEIINVFNITDMNDLFKIVEVEKTDN